MNPGGLMRMDNIGMAVEDIDAAIGFFVELGLALVGRMPIEGEWAGRVTGVRGQRVEVAMMCTPDGHSRLELSRLDVPAIASDHRTAPVNSLGYLRVMFTGEDIDDTLARLRKLGASVADEVVNHENIYRPCYIRGPEGIVAAAQLAPSRALENRFKPALFVRNGGSIGIAALIVVASGVLALLLGGGGIPFVIGLLALMVVLLIVFAVLVKAPTPAGRKLLDEIEGLKLYLCVAERDELKNLPGPEVPPTLYAKRYEMLLPYAVALDVEDAWTRKFTLAAGAAAVAAATAGIAWYRGSNIGDLGSFSKAIGSSLSSQIASSSHAPGSSSGGGGGGR